MIRFNVWLVSCYAHVFILLSIATVTLPTGGGALRSKSYPERGRGLHHITQALAVNRHSILTTWVAREGGMRRWGQMGGKGGKGREQYR